MVRKNGGQPLVSPSVALVSKQFHFESQDPFSIVHYVSNTSRANTANSKSKVSNAKGGLRLKIDLRGERRVGTLFPQQRS